MGMQYSRGLVAGYPFENTANDIMGVNNGTVYGATFVDGQCGRALSFDGVDDYVDLGTMIVALNQKFTISCKLYLTAYQVGAAVCLGSQFATQGVFMGSCLSGNIRFGAYIGGAYRIIQLPQTTFLNNWKHCVLTYDGTNLILYINCLDSGNVAIVGSVNYEAGSNFGRFAVYSYKGLIDNVQIFNRALTVNEIKRLYLNLGI